MFHQIEMERWWYLTLRAFVHIKGDPICEALTAWKHLASADSEQGTLAFNCSCRQCLAPPPDVSTFKSQTLPLKLIQQILNEQLVKILLVNATILSWLILIFFFPWEFMASVLWYCLIVLPCFSFWTHFSIFRYSDIICTLQLTTSFSCTFAGPTLLPTLLWQAVEMETPGLPMRLSEDKCKLREICSQELSLRKHTCGRMPGWTLFNCFCWGLHTVTSISSHIKLFPNHPLKFPKRQRTQSAVWWPKAFR